jgi:hypothetical protein
MNFFKEVKKYDCSDDIIDPENDEFNNYIWKIFHRYIIDYKFGFSNPEQWDIVSNGIYFYGLDGCMGCYDPEQLFIKFKFFDNYKSAKKQEDLDNLKKEYKQVLNKIKELQEDLCLYTQDANKLKIEIEKYNEL